MEREEVDGVLDTVAGGTEAPRQALAVCASRKISGCSRSSAIHSTTISVSKTCRRGTIASEGIAARAAAGGAVTPLDPMPPSMGCGAAGKFVGCTRRDAQAAQWRDARPPGVAIDPAAPTAGRLLPPAKLVNP